MKTLVFVYKNSIENYWKQNLLETILLHCIA